MQWNEIVNDHRLRASEKGAGLSLRQIVASDHGRVVFSSPFRRLQKKAQVFSLEDNAAVRSRMTHSIEVSHIGRYIADKIADANPPEIPEGIIKVLSSIVETSCLLHDIGNPPFGHLGEAAIQKWFGTWLKKLKIDPQKEKEWLDFIHFDGNPQGFRIITKLQGAPGEKGLNLTCSQLMSFLKYPIPPEEISPKPSGHKKAGYFISEQEEYEQCIQHLNINRGLRHPIVFIMEAADDIAYSLSDIEDGIEKGLLDSNYVFENLIPYIKKQADPKEQETAINIIYKAITYAQKDSKVRDATKIMRFRISMINALAEIAATNFLSEAENLLNGSGSNLFAKGSAARVSLDAIRQIVKVKVYESREAEDIEISGYNVIHALLDDFGCLLDLTENEFLGILIKGKGAIIQFLYERDLKTNLLPTFKENSIIEIRIGTELLIN